VIELLRRADAEGRGFLVVKRAQALEVRTGLLDLHIARHHVDDIDAVEQILLEGIGDQSAGEWNLGKVAGYGKRQQFTRRCGLGQAQSGWPATQPESFALTSAETLPMSARPARRGFSRAINLPMSAGDFAPDCVIAASIATDTSASESCAGR